MQLTVEAVSNKFDGAFKSGEIWYVKDKEIPGALESYDGKLNFSKLKKGDVVEVDANKKWVKSIKVTGQSEPSKSASAPSASSQSSTPSSTTTSIARCTAVKAALNSPTLAEAMKNMDLSQSVSEMKGVILELERYILTGSFTKAE